MEPMEIIGLAQIVATVCLGIGLVFLKYDHDRKLELAKGEIQQLVGIHRDKVEAYKVVIQWAYLNHASFEVHFGQVEWSDDEQQELWGRLAAFKYDWGWIQTMCSPSVRQCVQGLLNDNDAFEQVVRHGVEDADVVERAAKGFRDLVTLVRKDLGIGSPTELTDP